MARSTIAIGIIADLCGSCPREAGKQAWQFVIREAVCAPPRLFLSASKSKSSDARQKSIVANLSTSRLHRVHQTLSSLCRQRRATTAPETLVAAVTCARRAGLPLNAAEAPAPLYNPSASLRLCLTRSPTQSGVAACRPPHASPFAPVVASLVALRHTFVLLLFCALLGPLAPTLWRSIPGDRGIRTRLDHHQYTVTSNVRQIQQL